MNTRLASAALVAGLLVSTAPAAWAATPPGILVVAQSIDDIVSLDPAEGFEFTSVQSFNSLYQRLVQPGAEDTTKLKPGLAESWTPTEDGAGLVFTLRAGAKFASGNPVRPEDVIFSLSRAVKLDKSPAFILNELGWKADNVDQYLAKVDDSHVKVSWPAKVGPSFALSILSAPIASIVDQATVLANQQNNDSGNVWLHTHSAGSGPFKLRAYQPHEALVLDANPTSPGDAPKLKGVILKNVADAAARRLLIEQGDVDIARVLGPDQIEALQGKPGIKTETLPTAGIDYLAFNAANADNPALKNPALWEAARWLVDYDGIANQLLKGQLKVHQAFLPEGYLGGLSDTPYKLDVAKAKSILAAAGLDKGLTIKLAVFNQAPYTQIAQALQATFAQAGIKLDIQPSVGSEVYTKVRARTVESVILNWTPDYFDPHSNASTFAINRNDGTKTLAWRVGWDIPQLSDKTQAAVEEKDADKRAAIYTELQREVQKNSPFVIAFQAADQIAVRDNVTGYVQGLNADNVFFDKVEKK
jgi:peptide/nickel transport system substrate-binding protein